MTTRLWDANGRETNVWDTSGRLVFGHDAATPDPGQPGTNGPQPGLEVPAPAPRVQYVRPSSDGSNVMVHPTVVDMGEDGWNGYRFWTADTPYPGANDKLENPEILASQDGLTWVVPPGVTNPIAPWPGQGFYSDPEMAWDHQGERMWLVWRWFDGTTIYFETATSVDGIQWDVVRQPPALTLTSNPWMSPTVSWDQDMSMWRMWTFGNGTPLGHFTAPRLDGPWTTAAPTQILSNNRWWHGDIIRHKGYWIGICSDEARRGNLMLSRDGLTWAFDSTNAGTADGYRATISSVRSDDGYIDVWVSTAVSSDCYFTRIHEQAWWNLIDKLPA